MSESESPCARRANKDPSSPPAYIKPSISIGVPKKKKRTKKSERRKKNDARPVGARRPRYAASGDVGEGEGGSEPNERSCGAEGDDCDGDVGDARKLVNASE